MNNKGKDLCSSVLPPAAYRYPFYAVQWHPEKSPFEWIDKPGMIHSVSAIRASFYTSSFFVHEGEGEERERNCVWMRGKTGVLSGI